jgi:hypothetical protein
MIEALGYTLILSTYFFALCGTYLFIKDVYKRYGDHGEPRVRHRKVRSTYHGNKK